MTAYPFIFHSMSLSLFASVIGPFGGFFASGFKRAFRIKVCCRFSSVQPVHIATETLTRFHHIQLVYDQDG